MTGVGCVVSKNDWGWTIWVSKERLELDTTSDRFSRKRGSTRYTRYLSRIPGCGAAMRCASLRGTRSYAGNVNCGGCMHTAG